MALDVYMNSLTKHQQFAVALKMARKALPLWDEYAASNELTYIDSVVGMSHEVEKDLLERTLKAVEEYLKANISDSIPQNSVFTELQKKFLDPIVSLQDDDWSLPKEVKLTFHSVYNLLEAACGKENTLFDESYLYVSANQSIDALTSANRITFDEVSYEIGIRKR